MRPRVHSDRCHWLLLQKWEDLELIYAGQRMADGRRLADYHVPPVGGCWGGGGGGQWGGSDGRIHGLFDGHKWDTTRAAAAAAAARHCNTAVPCTASAPRRAASASSPSSGPSWCWASQTQTLLTGTNLIGDWGW